ncbi:hypothetical protein FDI40_gp079 [Agrobacterium phage Atu_ph07]|uniref:Uncharacterized protein n=1 Tax=Agrobacterium phage Atu_ph07 TaxID=2024264 RepID=A0A223W0K7_9CAUD|nr:hypothetical protein FDI40_gp079 [Agrobacterium phage Atu_ph07]ASV44697.1 hypothetical protein [Agrobacterium phage Atu_ph07]
MNILTEENTCMSMNDVANEIDEIRYGVLDYTDTKNVDYHFVPLLFLESFNVSSLDLRIGKYRIRMPSDWHIIIADKHSGEVEVLPLKHINDREFDAFVLNPISSFSPMFYDIEIMNIFPDVKWYSPKLKHGHFLAVPLTEKPHSPCAYFIKDLNKLPDTLDISQLV